MVLIVISSLYTILIVVEVNTGVVLKVIIYWYAVAHCYCLLKGTGIELNEASCLPAALTKHFLNRVTIESPTPW
jgi:hypothetical protein